MILYPTVDESIHFLKFGFFRHKKIITSEKSKNVLTFDI